MSDRMEVPAKPTGSPLEESSVSDKVKIVFYTDPLCCWCWAFEQHWQQFLLDYQDVIEWEYCLGGMIQDWAHFKDALNDIGKPAQMGPMWMEARHLSGRPINDTIWIEDPPSSSYPACLAVKTASLQSASAGHALLYALQEAVMLHSINIAKEENLVSVAQQLASKSSDTLHFERFVSEYGKEASREAFRRDIQQARYHRISRFPTLTMTRPGRRGIQITGYRPYKVLLDAFSQIAPDYLSSTEYEHTRPLTNRK